MKYNDFIINQIRKHFSKEQPLELRNKDIFEYFRLGLVTGILDRRSVIEWADWELLLNPVADSEIIELSLSGRLPYSRLIWLLNSFHGQPDYKLPVQLILAHAGMIIEENPRRAPDLILGLRLLNAEEYLEKEIRFQLTDLETRLDLYNQGQASPGQLLEHLTRFLNPYKEFQPVVRQLNSGKQEA